MKNIGSRIKVTDRLQCVNSMVNSIALRSRLNVNSTAFSHHVQIAYGRMLFSTCSRPKAYFRLLLCCVLT